MGMKNTVVSQFEASAQRDVVLSGALSAAHDVVGSGAGYAEKNGSSASGDPAPRAVELDTIACDEIERALNRGDTTASQNG